LIHCRNRLLVILVSILCLHLGLGALLSNFLDLINRKLAALVTKHRLFKLYFTLFNIPLLVKVELTRTLRFILRVIKELPSAVTNSKFPVDLFIVQLLESFQWLDQVTQDLIS
jgi:hypothetical protein